MNHFTRYRLIWFNRIPKFLPILKYYFDVVVVAAAAFYSRGYIISLKEEQNKRRFKLGSCLNLTWWNQTQRREKTKNSIAKSANQWAVCVCVNFPYAHTYEAKRQSERDVHVKEHARTHRHTRILFVRQDWFKWLRMWVCACVCVFAFGYSRACHSHTRCWYLYASSAHYYQCLDTFDILKKEKSSNFALCYTV